MRQLDGLPDRGNYTLIIFLKASTCVQMSRKGQIKLDKGYYAYTGSAMGHGSVSLRGRVARHFRKTKKKHWDIDHLLANEAASITAVVAAPSINNQECKITSLIKNIDRTTIPITGFGASDCKHNCKSHLIQLGQRSSLEKIVDIYKRISGKTKCRSTRRETSPEGVDLRIAIEPATSRSIEELSRIECECFAEEAYTREHILSLLKIPTAISLIAKVDGDVAGFAIAIIECRGTAQTGHIITIDVAIKHRRKSIGLILLNEIESALAKKNIEVVYLEVRTDNQAARRLYQKQGYEETRRLEDYYSAGVPGLRLVKKLKPERDVSC